MISFDIQRWGMSDPQHDKSHVRKDSPLRLYILLVPGGGGRAEPKIHGSHQAAFDNLRS